MSNQKKGSALGTSVLTRKINPEPTPLLIVMISFDPSGEGVNHFDENCPEKITDEQSPYCGEQWCKTSPEFWSKKFFGTEGYTLENYYKEMSNGKFYFCPAKETQNNIGVVQVTLNCPHPDVLAKKLGGKGLGAAMYVVSQALIACEPYVDFASYDKNNDGFVSSDELCLVLIHAGYDWSGGKIQNNPKFPFSVCANSGRLPLPDHPADGVEGAVSPCIQGKYLCMPGYGAYTLIGEYRLSRGQHDVSITPHPIGTSAHELGHAMGFHDVYDYDRKVVGWPLPGVFSVMCQGPYGLICGDEENGIQGCVPTHLDPFQKIRAGLVEETVASDGIYTVRCATTGAYNVIRVNTPDPSEYFLIENRQCDGFDKGMYYTTFEVEDEKIKSVELHNYEQGGIIIWHIDQDIFDEWSPIKRTNGSGTWMSDGINQGTEQHDPGIVVLFKNGFENGLMKRENGVAIGQPTDPFFRQGDVFNSNEYISAATKTPSLNSFPEGVDKNYNLKIEVLSPSGKEMQIKITGAK